MAMVLPIHPRFGPGGDVFYIYIGAEAAFVAGGGGGGFQGAQGAEADEADDLGFVVAKAVVGEVVERGGFLVGAVAGFRPQVGGEEFCEGGLAVRGEGRGLQGFAGWGGEGEGGGGVVEPGLQQGDAGVAQQAHEVGFRDPGGILGSSVASPWARAKARSQGMQRPGARVAWGRASGVRPLTG